MMGTLDTSKNISLIEDSCMITDISCKTSFKSIYVSHPTLFWNQGVSLLSAVMIDLRNWLENFDVVKQVAVIFSSGSGFGSGLSSAILEELVYLLPSAHLTSIGLMLPHQG